jgi:transposase
MLHLSSSVSYYLYTEVVDMRKGHYGLSGIVTSLMNKNVMNGSVFVFLNKRNNKIKLLQWDGDGFALYEKHLEKGTFERIISSINENNVSLTALQLQHILQGVVLKSVKQKPRYIHPKAS